MSTTQITINAYDKFAKDYTDYVHSESNFWNRYLENPAFEKLLKDKVKGKKVLDLGCGSGISSIKLKKWGGDVVGIDISKNMLKIAEINYPEIEFIHGNIEKLPFKKCSFDVVASSLAIHYVKDLSKVFDEVYKVLKKEGLFVFSTQHPIFNTRKKIIYKGNKEYLLQPYFNNNKVKYSMLNKKMKLEGYQHTFSDIANKLIRSGFSIDEIVETTPVKEGRKVDPKDYIQAQTIPSFILFKATKK